MAILLLIIIFVTFISLGLPDSLFGVVWPVLHVELDLPVEFASYTSIIISLGTMATSFFTGKLIRKFGTGQVAAVSTAITVIGIFGISFSPNIWIMLVFSIILGTGAGAIDGGLNSFVAANYKARYMSWLHCFWGVGVTISPLIMATFMENDFWRGGYRTVGFIQLALTLILVLSLPLWKKVEGQKSAELVERSEEFSEREKQLEAQAEKDGKVRPIRIRGVVFALFCFTFYCAMEFIMGGWGASYLVSYRGYLAADAARSVSVYYGGIMAGRFIVGFFTSKLNDNQLIRIGIAVSVVGMLMLVFQAENWLTLLGFLFIGLGFAPVYPCITHATSDRFGRKYAPDITGYQMAFAALGTILFQSMFGIVASKTTFAIMPFVLLALSLLLFLFNERAVALTKH